MEERRYYATLATTSMVNKAKTELRSEMKAKGFMPVVMSGKILFTSGEEAKKLLRLRCVERVGILLMHVPEPGEQVPCGNGNEPAWKWPENVEGLVDLLRGVRWADGADAWCAFNSVPRNSKVRFSFKVRCKRSGNVLKEHSTSKLSLEMGKQISSQMSNWKVDLKEPELEVFVHLSESGLLVGIDLAKQIVYDGAAKVAGLDPVVSWGIVRTADIRPQDVVLDPMCGRGILLMQAGSVCPQATLVGCDANLEMVQEARTNSMSSARSKHHAGFEVLAADARRLPVRDKAVDAIVCDLPFGKQFGSVEQNVALYPAVLDELKRVVRPESGRAVLLTNIDNTKTLEGYVEGQTFWQLVQKKFILLGRMKCCVYLLATSRRQQQQASGSGGCTPGCFSWEEKGKGKQRWNKLRRLERPGMQSISKHIASWADE